MAAAARSAEGNAHVGIANPVAGSACNPA